MSIEVSLLPNHGILVIDFNNLKKFNGDLTMYFLRFNLTTRKDLISLKVCLAPNHGKTSVKGDVLLIIKGGPKWAP